MATQPWDDSPPTVEERYEIASKTSDLTVFGGMIPKDHKAGSGEVIAAAGLGAGLEPSAHRTGMALLRLHGEWQSAAKPHRPTRALIEKLAEVFKMADETERANRARENGELDRLRTVHAKDTPGTDDYRERAEAIALQEKLHAQGKLPKPPVTASCAPLARAYAETARWYANELRLLANLLKSRASALDGLVPWAARKGIPEDAVSDALFWWLEQTCRACDGHAFVKIPDQPALSAKRCTECDGTGTNPIPKGAGMMLVHIDYCLNQARGQLRARLHPK